MTFATSSQTFQTSSEANQYFVPVGLFQDGIEFEFTEKIFIDQKPDYYEFANQTVNLSEAELFAKFAASDNSQESP